MTTITIGSWRAVPSELGGYDIYAPGYGGYRGHAKTESAARSWLMESSGENYKALPAITSSELRCEVSEWNNVRDFGRCYSYRHHHYYHGDRRIGSVQEKMIANKTEYLTLPDGKSSCIRGGDLRWLCEQAGLRLVTT